MLGVQACVSEELGAGTQCDSSRLGAEQTVESLIHSTSATVTGMLMILILMPLTVCLLGSLRLHCRSLLLLLLVVVVVVALVLVVAAAGSGGGVVVAASIGAAVADAAAPSAVAAATKTH